MGIHSERLFCSRTLLVYGRTIWKVLDLGRPLISRIREKTLLAQRFLIFSRGKNAHVSIQLSSNLRRSVGSMPYSEPVYYSRSSRLSSRPPVLYTTTIKRASIYFGQAAIRRGTNASEPVYAVYSRFSSRLYTHAIYDATDGASYASSRRHAAVSSHRLAEYGE